MRSALLLALAMPFLMAQTATPPLGLAPPARPTAPKRPAKPVASPTARPKPTVKPTVPNRPSPQRSAAPTRPVEPSPPPSPLPRIRLEIGGGTNQFLPFAGLQLGYRLPIADDRLEIGLEQAVWNLTDAGGVSNLQASLVGLRFVLWPDAPIVPHVRLAGGLLYGLNAGGLQSPTPAILAGLGASWPITPNVGLSLEVTGGYPIAWRPSLGLWFAL